MAKNSNLSFMSANAFPIKIFFNKSFLEKLLRKKTILPVHFQLIPTNRCNFNCFYCSCKKRDQAAELRYGEFLKIIKKARKCGCKAVTITGGGEPLLHPDIGRIITTIKNNGMDVGLTTNGTLLKRLKLSQLKSLTWCRISGSDTITENLGRLKISYNQYLDALGKSVSSAPKIDWSFSYVLTDKPDFELLKKYILFANRYNFTHVRITPDLLNLDNVQEMKSLKNKIRKMRIDDSRVIYQERKNYQPGDRQCFISLLKPLVGADGWVYPCCGTQYARMPPRRDNDEAMRICKATQIDKFCERQMPFDGSKCEICYYSEYNQALKTLVSEVKHEKFV